MVACLCTKEGHHLGIWYCQPIEKQAVAIGHALGLYVSPYDRDTQLGMMRRQLRDMFPARLRALAVPREHGRILIANSWIHFGTQGIVQGTYETFV